MRTEVDRLRSDHTLTADGYQSLLCADKETERYLFQSAREVAKEIFGNKILIRGLIEISNCCRNDCLYCGIRKSNLHLHRYSLTKEEILACCWKGYQLGFRTFVLQGGELPDNRDGWMGDVVSAIHHDFSDCAITLSLGEKSTATYVYWKQCGANRYLLRHETRNERHYRKLHPQEMSLRHRLQCLRSLKDLGYQTGTGMMVGSPYQTLQELVEDIQYIQLLKPEMIGIGPFIPARHTPFEDWHAGSIELTARLYSIFRLMFPHALIPSTTAMVSLSPEGRKIGILAGANVVMPNLSPKTVRNAYSLYDRKENTGMEAAEGLHLLEEELSTIGYEIDYGRGDYGLHCQNGDEDK